MRYHERAAEEYFQRYREFRPTAFDPAGLAADRLDIGNWFVMPVSQTRDSGPRERSNFETFLEILGGESGWVEVHRFGHWGPGWFEIILVKPTAERTLYKAMDAAAALADYPVLDESNLSELEHEAEIESWDNWACGDYQKALGGAWGLENDIDDLLGVEWFDVFRVVSDRASVYWHEESGGMTIDVRRVADETTAEDLGTTEPELSRLDNLETIKWDAYCLVAPLIRAAERNPLPAAHWAA